MVSTLLFQRIGRARWREGPPARREAPDRQGSPGGVRQREPAGPGSWWELTAGEHVWLRDCASRKRV